MNLQQAIQFLELFALSIGVPSVQSPTLSNAPHAVLSGQVRFQLRQQSLHGYVNGTYGGIDLDGIGPNGTPYAVGLNLQGTANQGKITFGWT